MGKIFEKGSFSIEKFTSLDGLEKSWKNLQENSELYLTFESVMSYANTVLESNIVIYVLNESGDTASILPIRFEKTTLKEIYFLICHNFGFNLKPIGENVESDEMKSFLREVLKDLIKRRSILHFEPVTKEFSDLLKDVCGELELKTSVSKGKENLYRLTLKRTWKDFLTSLDSKFRKNLRYYERKIQEKFKIRFKKLTDLDDLETFFKLHSLSMKDRSDLSILEFKRFQDYYAKMISSFGKKGGLFNLVLNDKIVASLAYIDFGGIRYFLNIGVDPEYKTYSAGRVLIAHAIEDAINNSMAYFDFGKGDSQYKLDWGCDVIQNNKIVIWSSQLTYFLYTSTNFVYNTMKKIAIALFKINLLKSILLKR